ncbi:MAG: hypothetical protein HRF43_19925 [Phycisphaerae bacterium]|jgi:hypothetical protein
MATEWELARTSGRCALTGRVFGEGEAFFAALFETPAGFERRDYAPEAWSGPPEGCFCYWRGRVPRRDRKPTGLFIDPAMLTQIFVSLEDDPSEARQQFRFVLALLLMRKRLLRLEGSVRSEGREYWRMVLAADKSEHQVLNPRLTEERIAALSAQLTALLGGDVEAVETEGQPPAPQEPQRPGRPPEVAASGAPAHD